MPVEGASTSDIKKVAAAQTAAAEKAPATPPTPTVTTVSAARTATQTTNYPQTAVGGSAPASPAATQPISAITPLAAAAKTSGVGPSTDTPVAATPAPTPPPATITPVAATAKTSGVGPSTDTPIAATPAKATTQPISAAVAKTIDVSGSVDQPVAADQTPQWGNGASVSTTQPVSISAVPSESALESRFTMSANAIPPRKYQGTGPQPLGQPSGTARGAQYGWRSQSAKENGQAIYTYFLAKGLNPIAAAALTGNFLVETSWTLNPGTVTQFDTRGIASWGAPRWSEFTTWAKSNGLDTSELSSQLQWVWQELTTTYYTNVYVPLSKFKNVPLSQVYSDAAKASEIVAGSYEVAKSEGVIEGQGRRVYEAKFVLYEFWNIG